MDTTVSNSVINQAFVDHIKRIYCLTDHNVRCSAVGFVQLVEVLGVSRTYNYAFNAMTRVYGVSMYTSGPLVWADSLEAATAADYQTYQEALHEQWLASR